MKSDTVAAIIILTLFVGMLALPIDAAEVEGTYYDDSCLVDKTKLSLTGVGLLRYWGFKHIPVLFTWKREPSSMMFYPIRPNALNWYISDPSRAKIMV